MKKIFGIIFILISFLTAAEVKPFTFEHVALDSATQQDEFDYMLQYKLYGHDFVKIGNDVSIPDKSGWNGTAGNMVSNARLTLGGPILVNGTIEMGDGKNAITGPVRANSISMGNINGSVIASPVCLKNTGVDSKVLTAIEGNKINSFDDKVCTDTVPPAPINLYMPEVNWSNLGQDTTISNIDIAYNNDLEYTITVPKGENAYKIYVNKIHLCKSDKRSGSSFNGCKLYVKMQDGGRLTQIFVNDLVIGNHSSIQVIYETSEGDIVQSQDQYRGNLMFYTNEFIDLDNTDFAPIQGTFISTDSIFLGRNINIAGQLLANKLEIGNTLDGKNFRFVKFDPDTIDVKLDKYGGLRENDSTVIIPVELSDTATIAVFFRYCFDLKDGVTIDDFNIPPAFPICGKDKTQEVTIPIGAKVPSEPIKVNVKIDTLTELNDYLIIKIDSISGAILPNGKTAGDLRIKIIDAVHNTVSFDTTAIYKFEENKNGFVDNIKIINQTDFTRFYLDSAYTDRYSLDETTGELTLIGKQLDYESSTVDVIRVTLKDTADVSVTRDLYINVINVNEAPVLNDTTFTLLENLPIPTIIGTLVSFDEDKNSEFSRNEYAIISGNDAFSIDSKTGKIVANKVFNYETDEQEYKLKVQVYDINYSTTLVDSAIVTIKIGNTNDTPKFPVKDTTFFINENSEPGIIGILKATDEDNDKLTYKIIEAVPFIVDDNGNVSSERKFDFEKETGFNFRLVVSDGISTDTCKIIVKIVDINEPCSVNDTTFSIAEHTTGKLGNVNAKDEDTSPKYGIITYDIDNSVNYQVDKDGNVFLKTPLNYEEIKKDTVNVYITDGTYKDTAVVIINVLNVQEDIILSGTVNSINENVELGTPVGVITGIDGDSTKVTYSINTTEFKINEETGVITTNSLIDYEKKKEYPVIVNIKSTDGSTKDTSLIIKVIDINEPVHTKDTVFTIDENKVGEIGVISGVDEDGKAVKYTCDDTVRYHIDSDTGILTLVEPFDYEKVKTDTLNVFVTDGVFVDTAKVIIKVNNINEKPVLQKNDSLSVQENCKKCTVGTIIAIDPDKDPIKYETKEPGFKIDSTGVLKATEPLDYEKQKDVKITVIAKDPGGMADTAVYNIKIIDVNEPVHTKDTTCTIKENYTGKVCKITASDEDKTTPKFNVTDTVNYAIDTTGQLIIKTPIDYEKKHKDTVKVIVTDGEFFDTATVIIKVQDEEETVRITEFDNKPKTDTVRTNKREHEYKWEICEGKECIIHFDNPYIKNDTTIKVCNDKKTSCDSVVVLFNDAPPVVTLTNAKSTTALVDYITIEEEKDNKVYVNKKENTLTVTVKDTVKKTEKKFPIDVSLDTIHISSKNLVDYKYILDDTKAEYIPIGNNKYEAKETIKVDGKTVTLVRVVDKNKQPIDSIQTVSYTIKQDGKIYTISYQIDDIVGKRTSNYQVSYNIDSCTTVTYYLNDKKKIIKNDEGNIFYTVNYDYIDEYGNKAHSKVDIVYDNIPPKVKILSPEKSQKFNSNVAQVEWTVNDIIQDTLTLQRLEKGANIIIRKYVDKAGNVAADTVLVMMKEAKDIAIEIINPVNEINQDKVDSFYKEHKKYDPKKPYTIEFVKDDKKLDPVGIGFKVNIVLPSVSPVGGLATLDDLAKNGRIPVDDKGNITGASTISIPVETFVKEHCTEEFQKDFKKNGVNIPLYDVTYSLHLWIYTNTANYVNDFVVEVPLNKESYTTTAGTVSLILDWITDKDGHVKAKNNHSLGTSAYLTKLFSKSIAKHRCDYKEQKKGDKTVKKEEDFITFGYKRPIAK